MAEKKEHTEWEEGVIACQNAFNLDLGELQKRLAAIESAPAMAEAEFSLNFGLNGKAIQSMQMTMRSAKLSDANAVLDKFKGLYAAHEWHFPEPNKAAPTKAVAIPTSAADMAEATGKGVVAPPSAAKPAAPAPAKKEVMSLAVNKIVVTPKPDGKATVEFFAAGRKFADIYATQKIESLVELFGGGWRAEHFASAATYDVGLTVAYALSDKLNSKNNPYKDIVGIDEV